MDSMEHVLGMDAHIFTAQPLGVDLVYTMLHALYTSGVEMLSWHTRRTGS